MNASSRRAARHASRRAARTHCVHEPQRRTARRWSACRAAVPTIPTAPCSHPRRRRPPHPPHGRQRRRAVRGVVRRCRVTGRRASPRGRFLGGVAVGALVGALVAGGIVAVAVHDDGGTAAPAPSTTAAAASPAPAGQPVTSTPSNAIVGARPAGAEPSIVAIHDSIVADRHVRADGSGPGGRHRVRAQRPTATSSPTTTSSTAPRTSPCDFSDGSRTSRRLSSPPTHGSDLAVLKVDRTDLPGAAARQLRRPPDRRPGRCDRQRPRSVRCARP